MEFVFYRSPDSFLTLSLPPSLSQTNIVFTSSVNVVLPFVLVLMTLSKRSGIQIIFPPKFHDNGATAGFRGINWDRFHFRLCSILKGGKWKCK